MKVPKRSSKARKGSPLAGEGRKYRILPIYEGNNVINYAVGSSDIDYVRETVAFADNLVCVRRRSLKTVYNKVISLMYWYEYLGSIEAGYDRFFTMREQLEFVDCLKSKEVSNRKRSIYVVGGSDKQVGLGQSTITRTLANINEFYIFLKNFHYIEMSDDMLPFRKELGICPEKLNRVKLPETLTIYEVNTLIDACHTYRDKAIIATMVSTGLRIGEVCALKMEALDFKKMVVRLKHRYLDLNNGVLKTGERNVRGNIKMFKALRKYFVMERSAIANCDNVFVTVGSINGQVGKPLTRQAIQKQFQRLRDKTGISHFHAHIMRHTFATLFLSLRRDDGTKPTFSMLKQQMGHKDLRTTMMYAHVDYAIEDIDAGKPFENYMNEHLGI